MIIKIKPAVGNLQRYAQRIATTPIILSRAVFPDIKRSLAPVSLDPDIAKAIPIKMKYAPALPIKCRVGLRFSLSFMQIPVLYSQCVGKVSLPHLSLSSAGAGIPRAKNRIVRG
jgi:hypothetical protein